MDAGGGSDVFDADSVLISYHLGVLAGLQHVGNVSYPSPAALEYRRPKAR